MSLFVLSLRTGVSGEAPLTGNAEILRLSPEELDRAPAVDVSGIVTCFDPEWELLFLYDGQSTIYVYADFTKLKTKPGDQIRVQGVAMEGEVSPIIANSRITIIGTADLPKAQPVDLSRIKAGFKDCQWVELTGIVRIAYTKDDRTFARLYSNHEWVDVWLQGRADANQWLDRRIRLRGNCIVKQSPDQRTKFGFLVVSSTSMVTVSGPVTPERPIPATISIEQTRALNPARAATDSVTIRGIVTLVRDGFFFIQDRSGGIRVQGAKETWIKTGEVVEVSGNWVSSGKAPVFVAKAITVVDSGPLPFPKPFVWPELESGNLDGHFITLDALFMGRWEMESDKTILGLMFQNKPLLLELFSKDGKGIPQHLLPGALLRITGVAVGNDNDANSEASLAVFPQSSGGIIVLSQGRWWNRERGIFVTIIFGVTLLGGALWIIYLRGRIRLQRQKTELLNRQMELESQYRELFNNSHDVIFSLDGEGRVTAFNRAAQRLIGYSAKEAAGLNFHQLLFPEQLEWATRVLRPDSDQRVGSLQEISLKTRSGKKIILETSIQRSAGPNGRNRIQIIGRNITGKKQAEKEFRKYQEDLEKLASRLVVSEQEERRKIATELHELTGQLLTACKFKLGQLNRALQANSSQNLAEEAIGLLNESIESTRSLMFELSPPVLYELELSDALQWLLEKWESEHGIPVDFQDDGAGKPLRFEIKSLLFRIARELLVNVAKHARARRVEMSLARERNSLILTIADDGKGFDTQSVSQANGVDSGYGLFSVRDTLRFLGGSIELDSQIGEGTRVRVSAPLENAEQLISNDSSQTDHRG